MNDDNTHETNIKLSPTASIAVLLIMAVIGGGIYFVKPELLNKLPISTNFGTGSLDTLSKDNYFPQIENTLKLRLKSDLLMKLANRQATQAEYDALDKITINSIKAEPVGYFKNERAFWMEKNFRTVKFQVSFTAAGKQYQATGDFSVSGASDGIALGSVKVL